MNNLQPPVFAPKTSALAITSLVLGILSIFTCGLTMIPAIICGIIALNKIKQSGGTLTGQGQAVAGLVIGGVSLLMVPIMAAMLLPAVAAAREKARQVQCANNERQIALAYQMYTDEHAGKRPQTLDDLRKYVGTDKVFYCPSASDKSAPSYQLIPGTKPDDVILRENPVNHHGRGGNVTYGDGHVEFQRNTP